ncbi:S8 family serine peptidase [Deinococcus sp. QL22]|uniref:S8 family serine peptidase n=1 Tax=Deinococcus sp. QL22 TaxID=2939437 RepID=UPI00201816BD|nr:S8 family serine peptidase [Deinococcus sp. QL22]UQN08085.1 S8 family serine peptidase [Deinococcus sp. QL22]
MRLTHFTLPLFTALLLAGCAAPTGPQAPAASDEYVMTVQTPDPALSNAQLSARYGGAVVIRTPNFALLRVVGGPLRSAALERDPDVTVERNADVFRVLNFNSSGTIGLWGSGTIGLWGSGTIGLWGSGTIGLWGSGSGASAANTANYAEYTSIGLDAAQARITAQGRTPGMGVTIAVIDTGVDLNHPAFAGRLSPVHTWKDFVDNDDQPQDQGQMGSGAVGHGSEVAGLSLTVAPGARVMPLRVLDEQGQGDVDDLAQAIVWAADHGANVINLSLGAGVPVQAVTQAIQYANALGAVVVASAGNQGWEGLDYPAAEFGLTSANLAVGSVNHAGSKSSFSQYGSLTLLAPGEGMVGPAPEGQAAAWSGTSMSAPLVAGSVALAMTHGPARSAANSTERLKATAQNIGDLSGNAGYTGKLGVGRIDLDALTR